jgi:hypothetical protein
MSEGMTAYTCTPREAKNYVSEIIAAGLVPFMQSSPGMGKSAINYEVSNDYSLKMVDMRLSTMAPEDLSGLPNFQNGKATFSPFDVFPVEDTDLPEGKQGWLLFLDEFNSASKSVQAAAYKLVLDRMVGQHRLHNNVAIVCAGNLATDRAIVNPLSTAMQSRVIHLVLRLDFKQFQEDVMLARNWDSRIVAYLSYKPTQLHDFRPDHNDHTFCCPRTWEFMNKLIQDKEVTASKAAMYAGTITSGVAADFVQFVKVYENLPSIREIVNNPSGIPVPADPATRYATVTHLMDHGDEKNLDDVVTYIKRMPMEFQVLFFRGLKLRKKELRSHPAFRQALVDLSRYLHDDIQQHAA